MCGGGDTEEGDAFRAKSDGVANGTGAGDRERHATAWLLDRSPFALVYGIQIDHLFVHSALLDHFFARNMTLHRWAIPILAQTTTEGSYDAQKSIREIEDHPMAKDVRELYPMVRNHQIVRELLDG
jgi:hypothetical protein